MEVGGIENGCVGNFLPTSDLRHNTLSGSDFQLLFGFVWFWKIRLFYTQDGTNMAQAPCRAVDRFQWSTRLVKWSWRYPVNNNSHWNRPS